MKSSRYLLALDAGSGAGRCCLVDAESGHSVSSYREWNYFVPSDVPQRGFEFDAEHFWGTLTQVTADLLVSTGVDPAHVAAVSTTGLRFGFVLLDENGKEVFAIPNRDQRAWKEAQEIERRLGEAMQRVTGHWPAAIFSPARLLWVKRHRPEVFARATHLLSISDWLIYRLCGDTGCDPSSAAGLALYDVANMHWAEDAIASLDFPPGLFGGTRLPGTVVGQLGAEAARQMGLRASTPVVVGGADTQCAILGCGGLAADDTIVVAGTTTPVEMVLDRPVIDSEARTLTAPHVLPGQWVLESSCSVTGAVLRWFRDAFCQTETAEAQAAGRNAYELMIERGERSPIGAGGVLAMLGPVMMDAKHHYRAFSNAGGLVMTPVMPLLNQPESKSHCIRAILESFAYAIRANCEQIDRITGRKPDKLTVCGGTASSSTWLTMLSDVTGVPVQRPCILETAALGAAICAGVGCGVYRDFQVGATSLVRLQRTIEPNLSRTRQYDEFYHRWLALGEQLKHITLAGSYNEE
jgi:sugar (pentulose or hexulose) kinase